MNIEQLHAMREELEKSAANRGGEEPWRKVSDHPEIIKTYGRKGAEKMLRQQWEADDFETLGPKTASWVKDDLPWYTTAAGATGATLAAGKLVPKKYKAVGQIGGALLGTAAGLEGGKAIGRAFEKPKPAMPKVASPQLVDSLPETADVNPEEDGPPPPPPPKDMSKERKPLGHPAAILGKSVAGLGLGMAGGYAGMKGLDYGLKKVRGKGLPTSKLTWAIPATTAVLGMAYPYLHQATVDKMREAHLERLGKKRGG